MRYTKNQRAQLKEVFTLALGKLAPDNTGYEKGKSTFICIAMRFLPIPEAPVKLAIKLVERRLFPATELAGWLEKKHPELSPAVEKDILNGGHKLQETRAAWLKDLIKEFSE
jgi:hypothetical protein